MWDYEGNVVMAVENMMHMYGVRESRIERRLRAEFKFVDMGEVEDLLHASGLGRYTTIRGTRWFVTGRSQRYRIARDIAFTEHLRRWMMICPNGSDGKTFNRDFNNYSNAELEIMLEEFGIYVQDANWSGTRRVSGGWVSQCATPRPGRIMRHPIADMLEFLEGDIATDLKELVWYMTLEDHSEFIAHNAIKTLQVEQGVKCLLWRRLDEELAAGELTGQRYRNG